MVGLPAVAIAAFVLFDVLDIDGSQFRAPAAEGALTEPCSADTWRLHNAQPTPHVHNAILLAPPLLAATDGPCFRSVAARTHAPRSALFARAHVTVASVDESDLSIDPV